MKRQAPPSSKQAKLVRKWNDEHPVGTWVWYRRGGREFGAETVGKAYLLKGVAVVELEDDLGPLGSPCPLQQMEVES